MKSNQSAGVMRKENRPPSDDIVAFILTTSDEIPAMPANTPLLTKLEQFDITASVLSNFAVEAGCIVKTGN
jgi:hypothetical protein